MEETANTHFMPCTFRGEGSGGGEAGAFSMSLGREVLDWGVAEPDFSFGVVEGTSRAVFSRPREGSMIGVEGVLRMDKMYSGWRFSLEISLLIDVGGDKVEVRR